MDRDGGVEEAAVLARNPHRAAGDPRARGGLRDRRLIVLLLRVFLLLRSAGLLFGLLFGLWRCLLFGLLGRRGCLLLGVVVIVAAAEQRETRGANSRARARAQQGATAHPPAAHALPVISLAHPYSSRLGHGHGDSNAASLAARHL